jgi:hypothetical protein
MKHKDYKGHKVFCNCNASFEEDIRKKRLIVTVNYEYPNLVNGDVTCPDCGLIPWYYLDKNNEQK